MGATGLLERVRRPEYTGENRCVPCTAVNVVIAAVAAVVVAALALTTWGVTAGAAAGAAVLLVGLAAIYLRGYLVPGTPTLTARYFPEWLLRKFDKAEPTRSGVETAEGDADDEGDGEIDPARVLAEAGAIEECADVDDLCLTDEFADAWWAEIEEIRDVGSEERFLAELLDVPEEDVEIEFSDFQDAFIGRVDGWKVGQWESRAAVVADLAAERTLRPRSPEWGSLSADQQGEVLYTLRVFLEACPECESPVAPGRDTVRSCCREHEVVAMSCENCGSRLLESEVPEAA